MSVRSLSWEDFPGGGNGNNSSILAQEIPIHGVKKELDITGQLNKKKDARILIPGTYDYVMLHG